jgi:hypothetical protein
MGLYGHCVEELVYMSNNSNRAHKLQSDMETNTLSRYTRSKN